MLSVLRDNNDRYKIYYASNKHYFSNNIIIISRDFAVLEITEGQGIGIGYKHLLVAAAENILLKHRPRWSDRNDTSAHWLQS